MEPKEPISETEIISIQQFIQIQIQIQMEIRRRSILSTGQNVSLADNDDNGAPYHLLNAIKQKGCKSLQLLINAMTTTFLFL